MSGNLDKPRGGDLDDSKFLREIGIDPESLKPRILSVKEAREKFRELDAKFSKAVKNLKSIYKTRGALVGNEMAQEILDNINDLSSFCASLATTPYAEEALKMLDKLEEYSGEVVLMMTKATVELGNEFAVESKQERKKIDNLLR